MEGDPSSPPVADYRKYVRNEHWRQMALADVISMPDEWEYPWFAAWDLAFHVIPLAHVDPDVRQGAAGPDVPGMGDAPQRSAAGLRVGVR